MNTKKFPKISIVTPSFNQAELLEETIISVLSQDYPNLEYIIIDGGSTDGSVDVIKKYAKKLTYWVSEPDGSTGKAVGKGFRHTTGEIMAWAGCGDKYCPWAFKTVSEIFSTLKRVEWITTGMPLLWDVRSNPHSWPDRIGHSREGFFDGQNLVYRMTIQQESTFWRRSLWERAGNRIDEKLQVMPDFELWARFWQHGQLYTVSAPIGGTRKHPGQNDYLYEKTCRKIMKRYHKTDFAIVYHELRYFLSKIPLLRRLVLATALTINYDFKMEQWIVKKVLV